MSLQLRILLGRFLTRSGDQAWDFVVPLVLLKILPGQLRIAAIYYLIVRLAIVILLPRFSSMIDRLTRPQAIRIGLLSQVVGVSLSAFCIFNLVDQFSASFVGLAVGGIFASLGSAFMDIAIANELVPSSLRPEDLSRFNSRLRQLDLTTEVLSPVAAGLVLLIDSPTVPHLGFLVIVAWNIISFIPEYELLISIFRLQPPLAAKKLQPSAAARELFLKKLVRGWHSFFKEPIAPAILAYALLWMSVLSPHGVLLTAFLKDGWHLPEWAIGTFRGMGAVFGLLATVLFERVVRKFGLVRGSQAFLLFQSTMVVGALLLFYHGEQIGQIGFLVCILFSRVGLYGFSLGEMQIRQLGIREQVRGEVNGFASALTGIATLGLYGAGALLPATNDFSILIVASVAFVLISATIYSAWTASLGENGPPEAN